MATETITKKQIEKILVIYRNLPEFQQKIIQILAVSYAALNEIDLYKCLKQLEIKDADNNNFTTTILHKHLPTLRQKKLIEHYGYYSDGAIICNPVVVQYAIRDIATEQASLERMYNILEEIQPSIETVGLSKQRQYRSDMHMMRNMHYALYTYNHTALHECAQIYVETTNDQIDFQKFYFMTCYIAPYAFDSEWFLGLPLEIQTEALPLILEIMFLLSVPDKRPYEILKTLAAAENAPSSLKLTLAREYILRGEIQMAQQLLASLDESITRLELQGWLHFISGELEVALEHYQTAFKATKQGIKRRKVFIEPLAGTFFILALLQSNDNEKIRDALKYTKNIESDTIYEVVYAMLGVYLRTQLYNDKQEKREIVKTRFNIDLRGALGSYVLALIQCWLDKKATLKSLEPLRDLQQKLHTQGYEWLAMEVAQLIATIEPHEATLREQATQFFQQQRIHSIVHLIKRPEEWEIILNSLSGLGEHDTNKPSSEMRLVWWFKYDPKHNDHQLTPREQKLSVKGKWSKGRAVSLRRLLEEQPSYLTQQDNLIVKKATELQYYYDKYELNALKALVLMVGHPLVFLADSPEIKVEIVKGEPQLTITEDKQGQIQLQLSPCPSSAHDEETVFLYEETPTRYQVINFTKKHQEIAQTLGYDSLTVPNAAKSKVLKAVANVSNDVTVHSDIGGGAEGLETVPADATLHLHLLPHGEGLVGHLRVQPFKAGHYYPPGVGGKTLITELEGKRVQATRDLPQEQRSVEQLLHNCPALATAQTDDGHYLINEPEACLELLLELQTEQEKLIIEWPEGEKFRIRQQADSKQLYVSIKHDNNWFSASGELKIDKDLVLDMQELLGLLENNSMGRFVRLSNGEFLALTKAFRKRLDELNTYTEKHGKNELRFHPLASLALQDFTDDIEHLKTDKKWKAHIKRLQEAENLEPQLPSTLQAELRDYQQQGFSWLARLAHWGVGACLADDMGLGKTLQALALILTRAAQGPTLAVAPTSVCANWLSEAQRFAPTLRPLLFGSGDRQQMLDNLQAFDLVVCSYGLLQQEAELLQTVQWTTIVLDEAQAIKNAATKRSQAAMELQGEFKMVTTGTPIENHLGELWNLFRFINPGLLGSLQKFNENFAYPIERNHDKTARLQLKKLIQPFMLRRNKTQVLEELPSRTEIMLQVDLSQQELAFYEALRQQVLQRLENTQDLSAGQRHLQILGEIMRLRRACCNASLVEPDAEIDSSKLSVFGDVLAELLENKHKCLVFSQFVDHLTLIRQYLDEKQVSYQYLDGKTPAKSRKARVDAFQAGEGDVFLISLKAGGVGLNLTAADYVIHMDPWWNPAVEDQASDRAHRIGQQRPVTIYRLVANNTIEEKIVALHHQKRDLADSLLEGSDVSGKVSSDELLKLIQMG